MAQNRQKLAIFEKSGLAQAGAEAAAIAAQRRVKKTFSVPAPVPLDSRPSKATSTDKILPRPSTPPIPAPRRINMHPSVHQPEPGGKKPRPLPRPMMVVKSESSSQMSQSRPKVLRSSLILPRPQSQIVVPKQPPPPIAPKPALHRQLKQKPEEDESNRQRQKSSTLPQSWKVESQPYGSEVESDTKDAECGTSTATEDNHQHGMAIMISLYNLL